MNNNTTVYVSAQSQLLHFSETCAGDSLPMAFHEAHSEHNPCQVCASPKLDEYGNIPSDMTSNDARAQDRRDQMSAIEWEYTFDPMFDLEERWGITATEAENFLVDVGYFNTERYQEIAEYFAPESGSVE